MTVETLRTYTVKDLTQLAKEHGVLNYSTMRKEQLVLELSKVTSAAKGSKSKAAKVAKAPKAKTASKSTSVRSTATNVKSGGKPSAKAKSNRSSASASQNGAPANAAAPIPKTTSAKANGMKSNGTQANGASLDQPKAKKAPEPKKRAKPMTEKQRKALMAARPELERAKNLAFNNPTDRPGGVQEDRLIMMVRDPYWLQAYWELADQSVKRAEAALGHYWHTAKPVLRLFQIENYGATNSSEKVIRTIPIHGGVNNWYIDVLEPPKTYRLEIGYITGENNFYSLAKSNIVSTPRAGSSDAVDYNWTDVAEHSDKIYAMSGGYSDQIRSDQLQELFEERFRRPIGNTFTRGLSVNGYGQRRASNFDFTIDAELIVHGKSHPSARVTLQGDPVDLCPDGTFRVRFALPDSRQIIPAVASSADGLEERTIVLAIERNTKTMEPVITNPDEEAR